MYSPREIEARTSIYGNKPPWISVLDWLPPLNHDVLVTQESGLDHIGQRKENKNKMKNDLSSYPFKPGKLIHVENYLEAVGIMAAIKAGVAPETVRRPLSFTNVEQKARFRKLKHEFQDKKITALSMVKDKKASKSI